MNRIIDSALDETCIICFVLLSWSCFLKEDEEEFHGGDELLRQIINQSQLIEDIQLYVSSSIIKLHMLHLTES